MEIVKLCKFFLEVYYQTNEIHVITEMLTKGFGKNKFEKQREMAGIVPLEK